MLAALAATAASSPTSNTELCPSNNNIIVNIIAYEFPFCLAGKGLLENLFLSHPTDTKLNSAQANECKDVNASKGVPHSYFYTADTTGDGDNWEHCELVTFDEEGCKGGRTEHDLRVGFSECFTKGEKLVKPIVKSARIECTKH